jgi:hypothetical protein
MSDNIDAVEHNKHAEAIAQLRSETTGLKEGLSEVKGDLRHLSSDIQNVLTAVQSNVSSGKPSLGAIVACVGLVLTVCIGFMTSVIMPMQEATDKRRVEQDEEDRAAASNLADVNDKLYQLATDSARIEGEFEGELKVYRSRDH